MADICDNSGVNVNNVVREGYLFSILSICLEHDFLIGHFKEKEALTKRWSDVITDALSILDIRTVNQ